MTIDADPASGREPEAGSQAAPEPTAGQDKLEHPHGPPPGAGVDGERYKLPSWLLIAGILTTLVISDHHQPRFQLPRGLKQIGGVLHG